MKTINPQTEQKLIAAVHDVVSLVNDQHHPTDAVIKVARACGFNDHLTRMLCVGYNTGAVNFKRASEQSVLDKFSDVPLADAEAAIKAVSQPEKTAETPEIFDPLYETKFSLRVDTKSGPRPAEKAASVPLDRRELAQLRFDLARQATKTASDANYLLQKFAMALDNLRFECRRQPERLAEIGFIASQHSKAGQHIAQAVGLPTDEILHKVVEADWADPALSSLKVAVDLGVAAAAAVRKADAAAKVWENIDKEATAEKQAGLFGNFGANLGANVVGSSLQMPTAEAQQQRVLSSLDSPEHQAAIRRLAVQSVLADLVSNDDVIRGYDPSQVASAYNELAQLAPRAAAQTAFVRPWLRKRLATGSAEPFEATEMLKAEQALQGLSQPSPLLSRGTASNVLSAK